MPAAFLEVVSGVLAALTHQTVPLRANLRCGTALIVLTTLVRILFHGSVEVEDLGSLRLPRFPHE